jgi:hypothetical protein
MIGRSISFAALVGLLGLAAPAAADLDLGVPTGTPLDWDKDLHQPIPTGLVGKEGLKPAVKSDGKDQGTVIRPAVPPPVGYASVNLYNFFRVKTHDIMTHFKVNLPENKPVPPSPPPPGDIVTGKSAVGARGEKPPEGAPSEFKHGIESNYIPPYPGELVWIGIATCLRSMLHPEAMSTPESLAYMVEIGEPTLVAPNSIQTPLGDRVKGMVTPPPASSPPIPKMDNAVDAMCARIAVLELTSGFPMGMDPRYAKRTLLLGDLAYEAVLACAKSGHSFLARNAAALLANYPGTEKVSKDLWALYQATSDPVIKVRCLAGISRKKDRNLLPNLASIATGAGEDYIKAMAIYALGHVAGPLDIKEASALANAAKGAGQDQLWSLLPALARIGCKDPKVQQAVSQVWQGLASQAAGIAEYKPNAAQEGAGGAFVPPNPEPKGYKLKILADMALIAAAACGDAAAVSELHNRASAGVQAFTDGAKILMAEILPRTGTRGLDLAKQVATSQTPSSSDPTRAAGNDPNIAVAAVRAMGFADPTDIEFLKQTAMGGAIPLVRAAALTALFRTSPTVLKECCHSIVSSSSASNPEEAFLVGMAIQMLDRLDDNKGEEVLSAAQKAHSAGMWAGRSATDEYDITKAKIDVKPPLLEVATLALGKTGFDGAVPTLLGWLKAGPVRGEAALALGGCAGTKVNEVVPALLDALVDPEDGWVRFCAYMSLKHISKKDFFTDFIFGSPGQCYAVRAKYEEWFKSGGANK